MSLCPTCRTQCEEGVLICPVDGTSLPAGLLGQTLGERYRILERIGEGGMGTVYLCEHVTLGKRMAVKVLRPEYSRDEELVRRFELEARAASQIGQENIIDVIDFGRAPDGALYFVMEALEGESLAKVMRREGPLPLTQALPILLQICRALGAAHARGIIHRDLKPENVILTRRDGGDFVKVLDFGISKTGGSSEGGRITRAGSIIGTPEYMAPEQAAAATVDHRCDIYSFGVLAYEMVTGVLPFRGETPVATLLKHQSEPPEPPRRRRPDLPVEAETLILKALVKRPSGRQQSMADVAADLHRALTAIGIGPIYTPVYTSGDGTAAGKPQPEAGGTARFSAPGRRPSTRGGTVALPPEEVTGSAERRLETPSQSALTPFPFPRRPRVLIAGLATAALVAIVLVASITPQRRPDAPAAPPTQAAAASVVPAAAAAPAALPVAPPPAAPAPPSVPERIRLTLRSIPSGALVLRGKERLGLTPLEVEVDRGQAADYRFVRDGFLPLSRRLEPGERVVEVRLAKGLRSARAGKLGTGGASEENPYDKVEDLKDDPFRKVDDLKDPFR